MREQEQRAANGGARFVVLLSLVACATVAYYWLYGEPSTGVDDANIYFTYARNAAGGHGFVFVPGGERVQGFSSEAWEFVCLGVFSTDGRHLELWLLLLNVVFATGSLWLACRMLERLQGSAPGLVLTPSATFLVGAVLVAPGFVEWNVLSLMETGLWSLSLTTAVCLVFFSAFGAQETRWSTLLAAVLPLLVVARPEGSLWAALLVAAHGLLARSAPGARGLPSVRRAVALPAATAFAATCAVVAWRQWYFGYPLPNTYYAKVSSDRVRELALGVEYFAKSCVYNPVFFLGFGAAATAAALLLRERGAGSALAPEGRRALWFLIAVAGIGLLVPLYTGGDHFALARFFQPLLPVLIVVLLGAAPLWRRHLVDGARGTLVPYALAGVGVVLAAALPSFELVNFERLNLVHVTSSPVQVEFDLARRGRETARELTAFFSGIAAPSCGVIAAGGFPYAYAGASIDLMGLNDVRMAHASKEKRGKKGHASFDKKTFYARAPDLMLCESLHPSPAPSQPAVSEGENVLLKDIAHDNDFWLRYAPIRIVRRDSGAQLAAIASTSFVARLRAAGFVVDEPWPAPLLAQSGAR